MKIVADDKIPYIRGVLEPFADVVYRAGKDVCREDVVDADALLVRTRTFCDCHLLAGSGVGLVATATIGTDHIDKIWCAESGVEVVSAPGCNAGGVLQWIAAVLAFLSRTRAMEPASTTIGIVGVGNVGSLVERYALQWGFKVLRSDPPRQKAEGLGVKDGYVTLDELAAGSDIVTFHVPFTIGGDFATAGLAGARFFDILRKDALVINASRGGIVDEELLLKQIIAGECHACIDTWVDEPNLNDELLQKALIATTHIAGYSMQGKANASAAVVAAVARKFCLPLEGWYPPQVTRAHRGEISFGDMCSSIRSYCDIERETAALKSSGTEFEHIRGEYDFREEYF